MFVCPHRFKTDVDGLDKKLISVNFREKQNACIVLITRDALFVGHLVLFITLCTKQNTLMFSTSMIYRCSNILILFVGSADR